MQAGTSTQRMLQLLQLRSKWQLLSRLEVLGTTRGGLIRTESIGWGPLHPVFIRLQRSKIQSSVKKSPCSHCK